MQRRTVATTSAKRATKLSYPPRCTSSRRPPVQVWPAFCTIARTMMGTARAASTSSNTICADGPPSSSTLLIAFIAAACCASVPTWLDPANAMNSMPGCAASAAPASSPRPLTMFSAPSGRPAAVAIWAKRNADRLLSSAGLTTVALPMASAGLAQEADLVACQERNRLPMHLVNPSVVELEAAGRHLDVVARRRPRLAGKKGAASLSLGKTKRQPIFRNSNALPAAPHRSAQVLRRRSARLGTARRGRSTLNPSHPTPRAASTASGAVRGGPWVSERVFEFPILGPPRDGCAPTAWRLPPNAARARHRTALRALPASGRLKVPPPWAAPSGCR